MEKHRFPLPLCLVAAFAVGIFIVTSRGVINPASTLFQIDSEQKTERLEARIRAQVVQSVLRDMNQTLEERIKLAEMRLQAIPIEEQHQPQVSMTLSCAELMSRPGSKYANGDFITRHTVPHKWTPRKDGSREFDLMSICSLKRYTSHEARQCLTNQHVNFIGDSLSRYQFNSLAYFIDKGTYPPRFPSPKAYADECRYHIDELGNNQCSPEGEPNVCTEVDWFRHYTYRSWDMLYQALGGGEDGGIFGGRMECDCGRNDDENLQTENMIYASQPDKNSERIVLSIFQERGWSDNMIPIRGQNFTGCAFNESCRFTALHQEQLFDRMRRDDYDYSQNFPEAIDSDNGVLRHIMPPVTVSIYNRGLWGKLAPERATRIFPTMFNWTGGGTGRC